MLYIKLIPFVLSCAYAIKAIALGATYTDAPIFLGLIAAGSFLVYRLNDKSELEVEQAELKKTLEQQKSKLEELDHEIKLTKAAKGLQTLQGRGA